MSDIKYSITRNDLEITWFSGTGAGGQHRNKHQNCCRIRHPETGVLVTGQNHRERQQNLKEALTSLANHHKIRHFLEQKLNEVETGISMEKAAADFVEEMMKEENIKEVESEKDWKLMTKGKTKEIINGVEIWT